MQKVYRTALLREILFVHKLHDFRLVTLLAIYFLGTVGSVGCLKFIRTSHVRMWLVGKFAHTSAVMELAWGAQGDASGIAAGVALAGNGNDFAAIER